LSMDNEKFKEVHAERMETKEDVELFIKKHEKVSEALEDLVSDLRDNLEEIGERLHETAKMLDNPKY